MSDAQFRQIQYQVEMESTRRRRRSEYRDSAYEPLRQRSRVDDETIPLIEPWLSESIPFFRKYPGLFSDLQNTENNPYFLIQGSVQGGKTPVIAGLTLFLIKVMRLSVIVVVRNYRADQQQLQDKFEQVDERFYPFGITVRTASDRSYTFNPYSPTLTIALENKSQLSQIVESYKSTPNPNHFAVIVDEADAIAYKKGNPQVIRWLRELQSQASQNILVTATAFDVLYLENELKNHRIYTIPRHFNYKGVDHPGLELVSTNINLRYSVGQPIAPELLEWYETLNSESPFQRVVTEDGMEPSDHPIICLQKTETNTLKQTDIMCTLASDPRFRERFAILVYNGKGVDAYWHELLPERLPARLDIIGTVVTDTRCDVTRRWYKKASIRDVLGMFRAYRHQYPVTHIVIIAGFTVARGLNIVSTDYKWHLTHEIMYHSPAATVSDLLQSCRVLGIYNDAVPLKVYCKPSDARDIQQAHYLQTRLIEGATLHEVTASMPSLCSTIRVLLGSIPVRRTTKKCAEPVWNTVQTEAEQYAEAEIENKEEDDGSGWLVYQTSEIQKKAYQDIEKVLLDQGWINMWVKRSDIQMYIPEREWDLRDLKHNSSRIGETIIQYRKINGRVEYKLLR